MESLKHAPSEVFGLPKNPDNYPWIWREPNAGERFSVGDFVVFRNSGDARGVRIHGNCLMHSFIKNCRMHSLTINSYQTPQAIILP
jgi:hypothetical protein